MGWSGPLVGKEGLEDGDWLFSSKSLAPSRAWRGGALSKVHGPAVFVNDTAIHLGALTGPTRPSPC